MLDVWQKMFMCSNFFFIVSVINQPSTWKDPRHTFLARMSFIKPYFDETTTNTSTMKTKRPNAVMVFSCNERKKEEHINKKPGTKNINVPPTKCPTDGTFHSGDDVVVVKEMLSPHQDSSIKTEFPSFGRKAYNYKYNVNTINCADCGKTFKSKTTLDNHTWTWHRLEKTVPCPQPGCGKMFRSNFSIKNHLRVCHDFKKIKCDFPKCKFSCLYFNQMHNHKKRVHLKQKAKKCEEQGCEKSFNETTGLEDHLRKAHGYKELECGLESCGGKFKKTTEFRRHRNEVHGLAHWSSQYIFSNADPIM